MGSTVLYLGMPRCGKSTLMRHHVEDLARGEDAPLFFINDHGATPGKAPIWEGLGPVYRSTLEWWRAPSPVARFCGVPGVDVAQLAIDAGWSCYVDDECDSEIDRWKEHPLRRIVLQGAHLPNRAGIMTCVSAMLATHRPVGLPTDVLGCFARIYVGQLQSYADAERVHKEGWIRGTTSAREALALLQARRVGEFTAWP